jgi:hypothetical protein
MGFPHRSALARAHLRRRVGPAEVGRAPPPAAADVRAARGGDEWVVLLLSLLASFALPQQPALAAVQEGLPLQRVDPSTAGQGRLQDGGPGYAEVLRESEFPARQPSAAF